jgi:hypothetical protein
MGDGSEKTCPHPLERVIAEGATGKTEDTTDGLLNGDWAGSWGCLLHVDADEFFAGPADRDYEVAVFELEVERPASITRANLSGCV